MLTVAVVMFVAAAAVIVGVVVVALGRGGEMALFRADYAPVGLEHVSATDVVLFRPPTTLFGYNQQVTDEALSRIAEAITARDIEIAALQRQLAGLQASPETGPQLSPETGQRMRAIDPARDLPAAEDVDTDPRPASTEEDAGT